MLAVDMAVNRIYIVILWFYDVMILWCSNFVILFTLEFEDGDLVQFMYYFLAHGSEEADDAKKETKEQFPGRGWGWEGLAKIKSKPETAL